MSSVERLRHLRAGRPYSEMRRSLAAVLLVATAGCPSPGELPDAGDPLDASVPGDDASTPDAGGRGLPVLHAADAAAAERGGRVFPDKSIGGRLIPRQALSYLWLAWGTGPAANDDAYQASFRARYGFAVAPFPNDGYPAGLHAVDATYATLDCLACHAGELDGQAVIGLPNTRFDLQGFFDDLYTLSQVAATYGITVPPFPVTISGRTQAQGANDAMGLGFEMASYASLPGMSLHTRMGFQRAPAWWSLKHKTAQYLDGSGEVGNSRTMMATLLVSQSLSELQAQDATFEDLFQYLLTLDAPRWPYPLDTERASAGRQVFGEHCASCHGTYDGEGRSFPSQVVPAASVGTDPTRASALGAAEAGFVNASWFGAQHPMHATGGYLAPDLTGVWATAPYLHNGTVPTLAALLDSPMRPVRWKRATPEHYDSAAVGWATESVATAVGQASLDARRVIDTTAPGLSNAGHLYGDALSAEDRAALLEYLKSL